MSSNYTITFTSGINFAITPKAITATPTSPQSKIYGAADPILAYTFSPSLVGSDSFSGSLTRAPGENVGSYGISQGTLSLSSNYTLSFTTGAQFTINADAITLTPSSGQSKIFGSTGPVLAYTFSPALIGSDSFNGSLTRETGENVGSYAIDQGTLSLSSNYALTFTSGVHFAIASDVITVTPTSSQTKFYVCASIQHWPILSARNWWERIRSVAILSARQART